MHGGIETFCGPDHRAQIRENEKKLSDIKVFEMNFHFLATQFPLNSKSSSTKIAPR
jgi:hypothetical protein